MIAKKIGQTWFVFATVATTTMGMGTTVNLHAQNCDPPPSGLVSWWPGETNAVDIVGTNNGVLQGGMTFVAGEVGQAFSFNGTDADVMIPASTNLNVGAGGGFTVEAWIKPSDISVNHPIVEWDTASDFRAHFWFSTPPSSGGGGVGCIYADLKEANAVDHTIASAGGILTSNVFQHVALTYLKASGVATLYLNGAVVAQQTLGSFTPDTTGNLYLGLRAAGAGTGLRYQGLMDEVDVFNRVLSTTEILAIYSSGSAGKCKGPVSCVPPPTGLVSWWPAETNAVDIAGTNNGVIQGGLTFVGGEVGQAFNFNGTDADVMIPASASLNVGAGNGLTVDAWIKPSDISVNHPIVEWDTASDFRAHFWLSTPPSSGGGGIGCIYADLKEPNATDHTIASAAGILNTNVFQHVALTYDKASGVATLYLNGAVVAQQTLGSFTPDTTGNLYLGLRAAGPGTGLRFPGLMDEVDVFGRALSATEIQAIYSAGSAGKCKGSGACDARPSGLTSWWQGESDAGDAVSTNNGVLEGNLTFAAGQVGQAFNFNGTDADVLVPFSASLNVGAGSGLTVDAWIKPSDISINRPIIEWDTASDFRAHFWLSTPPSSGGGGIGCIYADLKEASATDHTIASTAGILNSNVFQHVALTYDKASGVATLYLNGAVVAQQTLGSFTPDTTGNLYLGLRAAGPGTGLRFQGLMDEVDVFSRALSATEIQAIYNAARAGKCGLPPSIVGQPQSQAALTGNNVTFSVLATGSHPLAYHWILNTTNILVGATNASLTLTNVQPGQAGNYSVVVSNSLNSVSSSNAMLTVNGPPVCDPPPSGLVSWWAGETNTYDSLGVNNGVAQGGLTFALGEVGRAFSFNGTDANVLVPASTALNVGIGNGLTVDAWIKPSDISVNHPMVEWDTAGDFRAHFWFSTPPSSGGGGVGCIYADLKEASATDHTIASAAGILNTNIFQHVALTYDKASGVATLYLNGTVVAQQTLGSFTPDTTGNLYLGLRAAGAGTGLRYQGLMDEVDVFSRALSATEIQAIYNAGSAGKCATAPAPSITTQPQSQTILAGNDATFSVSAVGAYPLTYQWFFNVTNIISGATNSSLTVFNVQTSNAGKYSVAVSNSVNFVISSNALLTVNVPVCEPAPAGLVSWWPGETNALDIVNTNNGLLQVGVTFQRGKVGQAFEFDGNSGYISIPASPSLNVGTNNGLTIECWINPNDVTSTHTLATWNNGAELNDLSFSISEIGSGGAPGSIHVNLVDTSSGSHTLATTGGLVKTNVFQHVAVTYDKSSGVAILYYNGIIEAAQNLGSFTPQTSYNFLIGYGPHPGSTNLVGGPFSGLMDEVTLYNRALSSSEIAAIYNADTAGKCAILPIILTQPQSQTLSVGDIATFTVSVNGSRPFTYQWRFGTNNLAGATNSTLTLGNLQTTNSGNYSVKVSNAAGFTISSNALLTVNPPVCDTPPSGLVSWWRAESDAVDSLGANSGFLQGGMAFANGQVGQAFKFNGIDADVMVPASSSLNVGADVGLTIDAWINPTDLNERPIVEWDIPNGFRTHFWYSAPVSSGGGGIGSLYADLKDANNADHTIGSPPGLITTNEFQHVALTYDKSSGLAALYLNGSVVAQTNLGVIVPDTTGNLFLGLRSAGPGTGRRFLGLMDEVDVFNRALSASEIMAIYNAGVMGKCVAPQTVAPSILTQPQSQTVRPGTNITLTVLASGSTPLHYQWRLNGTNVPGATTAALNLTNVQPSQAGNYSVVITNSLNSNNPVISSNATLKINVAFVQGNGQPLTNAQYSFIGSVIIQLQNAYTNGVIFYTLDGSTPTAGSTQYSGSFVVTNSAIIRALVYSPDFSQSGQSDPIAIIILPTYTLTVTTAGGGTVSINTNGPYASNTLVTLTAHPASGWTFFQWLGDASGTNTTNTVTIDRNEVVHAVFGTTLSTTVAPSGSGSVMLNPPGGLYPYGTTVLISALPQAGNYFVVWDNAPGASGNANPLSYTVTNPNPTVSSLFAALNSGQVSLAVVPVGRGRVSVNPSGNSYSLNQSVTVTATPDAGQSFVNWSGDASGAQNPLSVSMTKSKTIYANFSKSGALSFQPLASRSLSEGFELTLNGEYGTAYRIDGSTNLTTWVPLITLTNSLGTLQYIDYSTSNNFSDRFYRAVPLP